MANAVIMPKAGITVESCIIGEWLKKPGDHVEVGDILFTYETDKANFECESTAAGELLECFYGAGDEVICLTNVCAIGEHGEDVSALRPEGGEAEEAAPAPAPEAAAAAPQTEAAEELQPAESFPAAGKIGVSPRAKGLAERSGTDLSGVAGSGPKGRVIERDVRRVMANGPDFATEVEEYKAAPAVVPAADEYVDVPFTGIRKTISRSMYQSIQSMAQLTHNFSFDASALKAYRAQLKACGGELAGITLGDMILYGVSRTLLSCPDLNALMQEENTIRRYAHVHLGVAVDTDRGLMVPTIFNADTKSLLQISREVKELAAMCRSGSISPDLLRGGTFTVSNLGAYGVESFTPVINPPQTGLLGVCTITERPRAAADGSIELYPAMGLSLTYDHRAVDGAPASRYMQELCGKLENFMALLAE